MTDLPYRQNVCMWVFNRDKQFLVMDNATNERYFKFPQGGVEAGESLEDAVAREISEEVGITRFQLVAKANFTHSYDWPAELQKEKGFRGQHQYSFLLFLADVKQAKINEPGIKALKWMNFDELIQQAYFPNQVESWTAVWKEFGPIVKNWK